MGISPSEGNSRIPQRSHIESDWTLIDTSWSLIRLQILLLPLQTSRTKPGKEKDLAFLVLHFPLLRGVVEFDVAGTVDFKPAEFMERNSLGPKTKGSSVGVKRDLNVHGGLLIQWLSFAGFMSDFDVQGHGLILPNENHP